MSSTFVIAARLRLKKNESTAWLRAAFQTDGAIDDTSPEVETWFWDTPPKQVKHAFGAALKRAVAQQTEGLVCARQAGAIWVYHMMVGRQPDAIDTTLSAIAQAATFRSIKAVDHALLFEETSARLDAAGALAVLEVGKAMHASSRDPSSTRS